MKKWALFFIFYSLVGNIICTNLAIANTMSVQILTMEHIDNSILRVFYQGDTRIVTKEGACYRTNREASQVKNRYFDIETSRADFDKLFQLILFAMANEYEVLVKGQGDCSESIGFFEHLAFN